MADSSISEEVIRETRAALERDVRINLHEFPIEVEEHAGRLHLSGTAEDIIAKRLAVNYALQFAEGRMAVSDELRVATEAVQDREIRDALAKQLQGERVFADTTLVVDAQGDGLMVHDAGSGADWIEALIDDGRVTLTGRVSSLAHKRIAELLAWWTHGTAAVENKLNVSPAEADNDDEIAEAIHIAFERDPLVHADQIHTDSAEGVVVLTGSVASDEERQVALADTWYIPGVLEVVDRIELHGDAPTHPRGSGASTRPYD
ncbi:BON domain-containing protein [Gilvimarinus sp. F26214L]|uniref:BON domain-containing protein n=1 Tax=Gilvimarinus sp. DZF01 TaxID=3461371 RepID=UPI0040456E58